MKDDLINRYVLEIILLIGCAFFSKFSAIRLHQAFLYMVVLKNVNCNV